METKEMRFFVVKSGPGQFRPTCVESFDDALKKGKVLASFEDAGSAVADAKIRTLIHKYKSKEGLSKIAVTDSTSYRDEEKDGGSCLFRQEFSMGGAISSNEFKDMHA